ncbi:hypothetical protein [Micromonospora sp. WMMD710]|uniref:hypothetical protein n=1 Tax=Micromonospora sp. WMMD710 TaxID=3016085 RepID=UPI0024164124|nr:hypothetical protein [Micromonospora sp. WMMD710]MDG4757576.1 hypothetical protein [Micromonospora sp. WMMD710]
MQLPCRWVGEPAVVRAVRQPAVPGLVTEQGNGRRGLRQGFAEVVHHLGRGVVHPVEDPHHSPGSRGRPAPRGAERRGRWFCWLIATPTSGCKWTAVRMRHRTVTKSGGESSQLAVSLPRRVVVLVRRAPRLVGAASPPPPTIGRLKRLQESL